MRFWTDVIGMMKQISRLPATFLCLEVPITSKNELRRNSEGLGMAKKKRAPRDERFAELASGLIS